MLSAHTTFNNLRASLSPGYIQDIRALTTPFLDVTTRKAKKNLKFCFSNCNIRAVLCPEPDLIRSQCAGRSASNIRQKAR